MSLSREALALLIVVVVVSAASGYLAGRSSAGATTVTSVVTRTVSASASPAKPVTVTAVSTTVSTYTSTATVTKPMTTTVTEVRTVQAAGEAGGPKSIKELVEAMLERASPNTRTCVSCHIVYTPDIVAEWARSRHAAITPEEAWKKSKLQREISSLPPKGMRGYVVGCYECHGQNPDQHPDTFDHFGAKIHTIVTPRDCATCHRVEVEQYSHSVMAEAYYNLVKNPVYMMLVNTSTEVDMFGIHSGGIRAKESACLACHGTKVVFKGLREITNAEGITVKVPVYEGWPNHGSGRVNPDGSKGACTACHPRHSFSIKVARSPYTCGQCHLDPDVPAYNVWKESKHGNIFLAEWKHYNMYAVPWVPGRDFTAPSCAACHMSLLATEDGKVIAPRTHDVDKRIWIRLFGVYAHPEPRDGATWRIRNKNGLPLPYSLLDAEPAQGYLIDSKEMAQRREQMIRICGSCHSENYARARIKWFEEVVNETNKAIMQSTRLMVEAWRKGVAKGLPTSNPFDEYIERRWVESWLFYANSIRYGAAMNGQDWAAFKRGWYQLTKDIQEMKTLIELYEAATNTTRNK